MEFISGKNLTDLWFNLLIYNATNPAPKYFYPYLVMRNIVISADELEFGNPLLIKDFFRFSGYNKSMKMSQLRKEYYSGKVEKQYQVIKRYFREFSPRQARAAIYFSEPSFDKTSKLKCLESLYLQKIDSKNYEAFITIRNSEVYPKLFMDFIYLKELLDELDQETGSKCIKLNGVIINSFLNLIQVKLAQMLLSSWGITDYSNNFNKILQEFDKKYPNKGSIDKIKFISIKRTLNRTFRLRGD